MSDKPANTTACLDCNGWGIVGRLGALRRCDACNGSGYVPLYKPATSTPNVSSRPPEAP